MKLLNVDPSGIWSERQANKVIAENAVQAAEMGLVFRKIEMTTFQMRVRYFMLVAHCLKHDRPVNENEACAECLASSPLVTLQ